MKIINSKKLKSSEIIDLIKKRDIYYSNSKYKDSDKSDPSIFKYIIINDIDKDYKNNIESLKQTNLCKISKIVKKKKEKNFI